MNSRFSKFALMAGIAAAMGESSLLNDFPTKTKTKSYTKTELTKKQSKARAKAKQARKDRRKNRS